MVVKFPMTMGGCGVVVNGQKFGHIDRDGRYFMGCTQTPDEFLVVSPADFNAITSKIEEVKENAREIRRREIGMRKVG